MSTNVVLPKSGMGIDEGIVARWLKGVGDRVEHGEPIAEIESAKATEELRAPISGTLVKILVAEGQSATVNSTIAIIE